MDTTNAPDEIEYPLFVVPIPIDADGRGPECDKTKVVAIVYQVWDQWTQQIKEFDNELEATRYCAECNKSFYEGI